MVIYILNWVIENDYLERKYKIVLEPNPPFHFCHIVTTFRLFILATIKNAKYVILFRYGAHTINRFIQVIPAKLGYLLSYTVTIYLYTYTVTICLTL